MRSEVCLCRRSFWHYRLRGGLLAIPAASELYASLKIKKGLYRAETTAFQRYAVKTSEGANMHNRTGLSTT